MKQQLLIVFFIVFGCSNVLAENSLEELAKQYFETWTATQAPDATTEDLENYLALLKDDVGHQHLPYDPNDERKPDNKMLMREGMSYYLGLHSFYEAKLLDQIIGPEVIVLSFEHVKSGTHPQTKQTITGKYKTTEILEVEDGKVSVIRKYTEKR